MKKTVSSGKRSYNEMEEDDAPPVLDAIYVRHEYVVDLIPLWKKMEVGQANEYCN